MDAFNRRHWLRAAGIALSAATGSGWLPLLAGQTAGDPNRRRQCVLLWMNGGPSTIDLWDMKPGHANGGEFQEIATSVSGLRICEHLPGLAQQADQLAVIRSLSTKEGDHGRGTYLMRTGHQPTGPIRYPSIGASLSKELSNAGSELPNFVSIAPYTLFNRQAFGSGFLGPQYAPLMVAATDNQVQPQADAADGYAELQVDDLRRSDGVSLEQYARRVEFWQSLEDGFLARHRLPSPLTHDTVYRQALQMMHSEAARAFELAEEPAAVRDAYGRGRFGQGCLLARRLIERGVPFVEVNLGGPGAGAFGWDSHQNNFATVKQLAAELDAGWATLMTELRERGLLESTTILWMGEFGRTPQINAQAGRDHFPGAWSCVLAGGGIRGGQAVGRTSADGTTVEEGLVSEGDVLATLCKALAVDPSVQNISEVGRPIKIAEGSPIAAVLA